MTATSYVTLDNDDLGANKIFRAATASALDTNPVSIAQRGTGAPWLNGIGAITSITSGSGNWTVPAGVYSIKVTAVGGGGGSTAGADTTFGSITGGGGGARVLSVSANGGTASGGDINIAGGGGDYNDNTTIAGTLYAAGGYSCVGGSVGRGSAWGVSAGTGVFTAGGGGGTAIKVFAVNPGDLIAYSVTANGIIIIEY
jgi:hypothetical protein